MAVGSRLWILKNFEDLEDLLLGATVLATGGGGSLSFGLKLARRIVDMGGIEIVDPSELPEEALLASPYTIGSMGSALGRDEETMRKLLLEAISTLGKELGREVSAIVASELGGGNTAIALYMAALLGKPIVDGDLMGRAGPELHQSTAHVHGIPVTPAVIVSPTGSVVVAKKIHSVDFYEDVFRYIAYLSGGWSLVIDTPLSGENARRAVIRGTLSLSHRLGRAIREARSGGRDVAETVARTLDGWVIFRGRVTGSELRDTGKFLEGTVYMEGARGRLRIHVKNEYLLALLNDRPIAMCPDLIMIIDSNGNPVLSNAIEKGLEVSVVVSRAPDVWRTPRGLDLFGPRHFGFNYDYTPVENLVRGA